MHFLFLDTNIFIHFRSIEEIKWDSITGTQEPFTIVLAPLVIAELDKQKYHQQKKVAARVRKLMPVIEKWIDDPATCNFPILYVNKNPDDRTYTDYHLDKREQDDQLIATIIEFRSAMNPNDQLSLITNDTGPRLKAKPLSIGILRLPEDYLLKNAPDELEYANAALKKELSELKNRLPVLTLSFQGGKDFLKMERAKKITDKMKFIESKMDALKEEYPFLSTTKNIYPQKTSFMESMQEYIALSDEQVSRYNKELHTFFKQSEEYISESFDTALFHINTLEIKLILNNAGSAPAEDIDADLHFPDGFMLIEEKDLPEMPDKPDPPYKPKHGLDVNFVTGPNLRDFMRPLTPLPGSNLNLNSSNPIIKKTNSYDVSFHIRKLKHNQSEKLSTLYAHFDDISEARGFTIDYQLNVGNLPKTINGKLNVHFVKYNE